MWLFCIWDWQVMPGEPFLSCQVQEQALQQHCPPWSHCALNILVYWEPKGQRGMGKTWLWDCWGNWKLSSLRPGNSVQGEYRWQSNHVQNTVSSYHLVESHSLLYIRKHDRGNLHHIWGAGNHLGGKPYYMISCISVPLCLLYQA